jgi:hypothetical protein
MTFVDLFAGTNPIFFSDWTTTENTNFLLISKKECKNGLNTQKW